MTLSSSNGSLKTKIISITNQKGGVGKTTTALNLSASLANMNKRILLIDLDSQGNASSASAIHQPVRSISDCLEHNIPLSDCIQPTKFGYDVVPATVALTRTETVLLNQDRREFTLKEKIKEQTHAYDYILIDCPPSLNILTLNALIAADGLLIPVQCEYFALEGLAHLLQTIDTIKRKCHPALAIEGILRTMYDGRNRLAQQVSNELMKHFSDRVFHTLIPRNVRLAESPSHSKPVLYHDNRSQGSIAYLALAGELIRKHQTQEEHAHD